MKIAIDARVISDATGRYTERLLHFLEEKDHDNDYLVLVRRADLDFYKPHNPRFTVVEADFSHYTFEEQLGFNSFLRKLNADLVHFCMPQQPLLYTKPAVTTVHDLILLHITSNEGMSHWNLKLRQFIFSWLLKVVARRSQAVIVPSEFTKNELQELTHVNPDKIKMIYNGGVTPYEKSEPMPEYQGKDFIMFLGRSSPYKNNRALIEAHQALLKKYPELRLVIVGTIDSQRQADIDWVKTKGFKNIDFTGFVTNEQQAWLYANTRAYVSASLMEGFGLPALEAMVNGAPVVSSNTTASPEILGDAAHYFDPYKIGDMQRGIDDVLSDPKLAAGLKQKGAEQARRYSWERMAEQTLQVYQQALQNLADKSS